MEIFATWAVKANWQIIERNEPSRCEAQSAIPIGPSGGVWDCGNGWSTASKYRMENLWNNANTLSTSSIALFYDAIVRSVPERGICKTH